MILSILSPCLQAFAQGASLQSKHLLLSLFKTTSLYSIISTTFQIYFEAFRFMYCPLPGFPTNSPLSYTRLPLKYV